MNEGIIDFEVVTLECINAKTKQSAWIFLNLNTKIQEFKKFACNKVGIQYGIIQLQKEANGEMQTININNCKVQTSSGLFQRMPTLLSERIEHGDKIYFTEGISKIKIVPVISLPLNSIEEDQEDYDLKAALEESMKDMKNNQESIGNQESNTLNQQLQAIETPSDQIENQQGKQISTPSTVPSTPQKIQEQNQTRLVFNNANIQSVIQQRNNEKIQEMQEHVYRASIKERKILKFKSPHTIIQAMNKLASEVKNFSNHLPQAQQEMEVQKIQQYNEQEQSSVGS